VAARAALTAGPYVGRAVSRREDDRVLRGGVRYVDDIEMPEMAHVAFVRSPHAHARVGAVRVPDERLPGVLAALTPADLGGRVKRYPKVAIEGMEVSDDQHPVLPEGEVRYVGQPVAGVVAESRALAEDFAEEIEVDYEPLETVVDPRASDRALVRWAHAGGDVEAAFARAEHVVSGHYGMARVAAVPIEARGAIARDDPDTGVLTVWISAQDTHRPLAQLAHILDRPRESIRIVIPAVGGAFGTKGNPPSEVVVAAVAAMDLGRPVKWTEDRLENLLTTQQGRGMQADVELALDADARILGVRARLLADVGGYLWPSTHVPLHTAGMLMGGCYDVPNVAVEVTGAMTHKVPTGPYRGAGRPEGNYFVECAVDDAARALGIEPAELRRRNVIRSFPYPSALGLTYDSGDYARCLDLALETVQPERRADDRVVVGTGAALYVERSGGVFESADVTVDFTGRVVIRSSTSPHGQGHDTAFAQIAADRLGVALDDVELHFGDSAEAPPGIGTFGSRSLTMGGSAVALAVDEIAAKARPIAAGRDMTLAEIAAAAPEPLHARSTFKADITLSSGCHAAVVEIERATGALRILRYAAVDDAGTIVNPLLVHGQVVGGVVQGIGQTMFEEVVHDETGQVRSASLLDYSLPTAAEIPPLRVAAVESPSPLNPLGAKGAGEGGATGSLPAIANAVADALGGRRVDPPFTAEKLWRALREAGR
jgi:aerobic carbon-monoxide dehydrogenase large subunit